MAKKVEGYIKLQIPAGKATPAPPVGPCTWSARSEYCTVYKGFQCQNSRSGGYDYTGSYYRISGQEL